MSLSHLDLSQYDAVTLDAAEKLDELSQRLSLNGLRDLTPEVERIINGVPSRGLGLGGLQRLSLDQAEKFAGFRGFKNARVMSTVRSASTG